MVNHQNMDESFVVKPEEIKAFDEFIEKDSVEPVEKAAMDSVIEGMLLKTFGNIANAAKLLNMMPSDLRDIIKSNPKLINARYNGRALFAGLAEAKLIQKVQEGDLKAIERVLRSFAKEEGWLFPEDKQPIINQISNSNSQGIEAENVNAGLLTVQQLFELHNEMAKWNQEKFGDDLPQSLTLQENLVKKIESK